MQHICWLCVHICIYIYILYLSKIKFPMIISVVVGTFSSRGRRRRNYIWGASTQQLALLMRRTSCGVMRRTSCLLRVMSRTSCLLRVMSRTSCLLGVMRRTSCLLRVIRRTFCGMIRLADHRLFWLLFWLRGLLHRVGFLSRETCVCIKLAALYCSSGCYR